MRSIFNKYFYSIWIYSDKEDVLGDCVATFPSLRLARKFILKNLPSYYKHDQSIFKIYKLQFGIHFMQAAEIYVYKYSEKFNYCFLVDFEKHSFKDLEGE